MHCSQATTTGCWQRHKRPLRLAVTGELCIGLICNSHDIGQPVIFIDVHILIRPTVCSGIAQHCSRSDQCRAQNCGRSSPPRSRRHQSAHTFPNQRGAPVCDRVQPAHVIGLLHGKQAHPVTQIDNLLFRRLSVGSASESRASADCQSATRQTPSLRYVPPKAGPRPALRPKGVKYPGQAACPHAAGN
jgi:hypothetical protein